MSPLLEMVFQKVTQDSPGIVLTTGSTVEISAGPALDMTLGRHYIFVFGVGVNPPCEERIVKWLQIGKRIPSPDLFSCNGCNKWREL